jgi:type IV pilus assembly protein PilC
MEEAVPPHSSSPETGVGPTLPAVDHPRRRRSDRVAVTSDGAAPGGPPVPLPVESQPWYRRTYGKPVKTEAILAFSRQLASFLEAGISIIESLEIVAEETASEAMSAVIMEIRDSIRKGWSFADAVGQHDKVFPPYYRAMVVSAEYTGRLDTVLNQLATYMERDLAAKRQVRSALTYPTLILIVAAVAMVVMAVFVLPKFSGLYRSLGARLPLPTRILLGFTDFMTAYWPFVIAAFLGAMGALFAVIGGARNKERRDRLAMRLPVVGNLFHLISIERFCRVLSALASAGVPLPDAIQVSADSTNNSIFRTRMQTVRETLTRGGGLSDPMIETDLFPLAARQMIRVGERTGTLGTQLTKAANYYEREVGFQMKKATDLFQPTVIMIVGGLVGFVAVAQVSAMYSIFGQVR